MAKRPIDTAPRKIPRQARARATVEAVLAAAAQVLVRHGYERATTARIAARAGVSIGSLYQYFPNKEALIAALIERHANDIVAVMARALDPGAGLEDGLRAMNRAGTDAHRLDPALHKVLNEQVPRVGRIAKAMDTSRKITHAIEQFLRRHARELRRGRDPATAALVVEIAIEAIAHKAVIERIELLPSGVLERETLDLVLGYLT